MNQECEAKQNGIALICVDEYRNQKCSVPLLVDEIPGAQVFYHSLKSGDHLVLDKKTDKLRTLLLVDGTATFCEKQAEVTVREKYTYVTEVGQKLEIHCIEDTHILEILWHLGAEGLQFLYSHNVQLPIIQKYEECNQYREEFKSTKSISRAMIDHHILPGFCMGSNESYGPDNVGKHAHPLLDQFFFSFEDNEVDLLIDDMVQPYKGNTLIHIPLGSDHGVSIPSGKKMHYVWIDFMVDPGAVDYLDEVHKKTGVLESFDEEHQIVR